MLWFNGKKARRDSQRIAISIHLMLWFNHSFITPPHYFPLISIHLMLWFNFIPRPFHQSIVHISIHLMLWFNGEIRHYSNDEIYFNTSYVVVQLCTKLRNIPTISNFNTSYVVVQRGGIPTLDNPEGISIHLMLWFNG